MPDTSFIYWDVRPELFSIGPITVRWYGVLFALGFLVGFFIMQWIYRWEHKLERDLDHLLLYMLAGTMIGARLGHVLFYAPGHYFSHPLEILKIWEGGLASHGGALGIFIVLWIYTRSRPDQPYRWLLDRMAVPAALAGSFIRLGNLFNSEILGTPTEVPWAFVFARVDLVPRHPAQLYEAIAYLLVFGVLLRFYRRLGNRTPRGLLAGLFLVLVFGARFLIEFVKVRQAPFAEILPLSMGQWLSIPMVVIGLFLLQRAWPRAMRRLR